MKTIVGNWQTKERLLELLVSLVKIPSITGSKEEVQIANYLFENIKQLPYFEDHENHLQLHPTGEGRNFLTALVKGKETSKKTIILVSHFDVVDIKDYGKCKDLAFDPKALTERYIENKETLPESARKDIEQGNWLFGRGIMDMKAGLTLHMSMLEKACKGEFDGNILLVSVCDEEGNSTGMREAVPVMLQMAEEFDLEYVACLNSEPIFTQYPDDQNNYIYSGSVGKLNPGFLCYGKETHVGEPLSGINANLMVSEITKEIELNPQFCESVLGEVTPPPTNLIQKGLKDEYSAKIPHNAVTLFNMFMMEKSVEEVNTEIENAALRAAKRIEDTHLQRATEYSKLGGSTPKEVKVNVVFYEDLLNYAKATYGQDKIDEMIANISADTTGKDARDLSVQLIDEIAHLCQEKWPMIVPFFAPPFYPAVNSGDNLLIRSVVDEIMDYAEKNYNIAMKEINYFPGVSDLSYTKLQHPADSYKALIGNMPLWDNGYTIPFKDLEKLNVPSLNLGPIGRDAHKWTERLDIDYTFETLRDLMLVSIKRLLK